MAEKIRVYTPTIEEKAPTAVLAPRLKTLAGKRVALIHNGWDSLDPTYVEFTKRLREKYETGNVFVKPKAYAGRPMPEEELKQLLKDADAVIVGLGN